LTRSARCNAEGRRITACVVAIRKNRGCLACYKTVAGLMHGSLLVPTLIDLILVTAPVSCTMPVAP